MEAYLKEGGGGDHLTVRVRLPSGRTQTPLMKNLYTKPPVGKSFWQLIGNYMRDAMFSRKIFIFIVLELY